MIVWLLIWPDHIIGSNQTIPTILT